jgi:hypothetical protein
MRWAWRPQAGPQKALVDGSLKEIFFGGTRGGGKTDGVLGKWALKEKCYRRHFNAIRFQRTPSESCSPRPLRAFGSAMLIIGAVLGTFATPFAGQCVIADSVEPS